jgi:SM-20-related protein|tara:strand:+ start:2666 stop:3181 length:516 start_codon:yes stop_codon:yes gene_type:complete
MQLELMPPMLFVNAGVGRAGDHTLDRSVRTDKIAWITGSTDAEKEWLKWVSLLQDYLNRRLFLGLSSFESHFSYYGKDGFYAKHKDSFRGKSNRVLSIVVYTNKDWLAADGGELLIYGNQPEEITVRVAPVFGTVAIFLSQEVYHEVLDSKKSRFSIAGWFRSDPCWQLLL